MTNGQILCDWLIQWMLSEQKQPDIPGCVALLGNGADATRLAPRQYKPYCDFNDAAIPHGLVSWVNIVSQELDMARD